MLRDGEANEEEDEIKSFDIKEVPTIREELFNQGRIWTDGFESFQS